MFGKKTNLVACMLIVCMALSTLSSAGVLREIWDGGRSIDAAIDLANSGTPADQVDILENPTWVDIADNYSARMTGWLTVPETGEYTIYVAGDDYQRLYVSQDDNPFNAVEIARVDGWTSSQEWTKYESQAAAPMMLTEGQVLAFVGIMQEGGGGDGQDWGWIAPGSEEVVVIPGELFVAEYEVTAPGKPKNPSPADGATDIIDVVASWEAPEGLTFDVYGGADPEAMDLLAEGLTEATLPVGSAGVDLEVDTTYYWQVVASNGTESPVWSFTTEPRTFAIEGIIATTDAVSGADGGTAQQTVDGSGLNENDEHSTDSMEMWLAKPADGELVAIQYEFPRVYKMDEMLVWNSNTGFEGFLGYGFKDVTVEYSVDGVEWTVLADVEFAQAPGADGYAANTAVDMMGVAAKFVKLTANTNWLGLFPDAGLSEVRFMYVPAQPRIVAPADGATGMALDTELDWYGGRGAVSSDVILNGELIATVEGSILADAGLVYGMPYTWQVNENDGENIWEGDVWSFSTTEFEAIAEDLTLEYDNSAEPYLSEVVAELDGMNIAATGADTLRVSFAGLISNAASGIYVAIEDTAGQVAMVQNPTPDRSSDGLVRERWNGGVSIDEAVAIAESGTPADEVAFLAEPLWDGIGDNYAAKMSGLLTIPADGEYTFYVASDDYSKLFMSQDDDPANAELVAFVDGWTNAQVWDSYETQKSETMTLVAGQVLAVYAVMQEGGGGDNCGIGWTTPDSNEVTLVPGEYWSHTATSIAQSGQTWSIPLQDLDVDLTSVARIAVGAGDSANPVAGGTGTVLVSTISIGTPMSHNVEADITGPDDMVVGVPNDGLMDGDNFGWPGAETPDLAVDNDVNTKFLHFKGELEPTGIQLQPAVGPTVVTGLTLTTANDAVERDPISFELYGSNESIDGPYELIAAGDVVDFAGAEAWPRFTKNETPIEFENTVAYTYYQILFPTVRDAGSANSMQIAEIELIGVSSW